MLLVFQRRRAGWTLAAIAEPLGVSAKSVEAVVLGKSHVHVLPGYPDRVACVRVEQRKLDARRRGRDPHVRGVQRRRLNKAYWE